MRVGRRKDTAQRTGGLTAEEMAALATFLAERDRGIMHTPDWRMRMAVLQAKHDRAAEGDGDGARNGRA